ncbi:MULTISPECIES: histidine kinase N-terminal 7TM domain-containing protein [Halorussus]|uniref:sensor histidine kinase n=1 Tax=Halorussus TaxID=1070314 RepID=UPI000E216DF3|nr:MULTISPECIES: histidine kinase N-terminal 7TM domain-containing protein [Halorussus]NHN61530.1 PAS domain-containing protein [Halorussus sp. JP-T4]
MPSAQTTFAAAVACASVFTAGAGLLFWRRNESDVMRTLAGILGAHAVVGGFVLGQLYAPTRALSQAAFHAHQVVGNGILLLWFVFTVLYVGRSEWVGGRFLGVLGTYYVVEAAVIATNPVHGLVWPSFRLLTDPFPYLTGVTGVGWFVTLPGVFLYLAGLGLLVQHRFSRSRLGRRRTGLLAAAMTVQFLLPFAIAFQPVGPANGVLVVGSVLVGLLAGWSVFYEETFDVTPVARMTVFDQLDEGVLVVDRERRVLDYNRRAERLFPAVADGAGDPLDDAAPELVGDGGEFVDRAFCYRDGERREFTVDDSTLATRGSVRGHVLVVQDVTERERYLLELEQHADQLERFASTLSHDLRNPLNVAKGNVELALETGERDRLEAADEALDRIDRIIEDLLTLAREGRTIEEREVVPLAALAEDAWRTTDTGDAALELDIDPEVAVYADETRLRNVFENLFRNSVEHGASTADGGSDDAPATVRVGALGDGFFVEDDGPGVPPEDRERVFEYEYTTTATGTGLGLAIVETIANAHGWRVSAEAGSDGGARFAFSDVDLVDPDRSDDAGGTPDDRSGDAADEDVPVSAS